MVTLKRLGLQHHGALGLVQGGQLRQPVVHRAAQLVLAVPGAVCAGITRHLRHGREAGGRDGVSAREASGRGLLSAKLR